MKFNYLFKSQHNGHFDDYQTVTSNTIITQEKVTAWLKEIPGVERTGADINQFCEVLQKRGIEWGIFECPCCVQRVTKLSSDQVDDFLKRCKVFGIEFVKLEGISGNY